MLFERNPSKYLSPDLLPFKTIVATPSVKFKRTYYSLIVAEDEGCDAINKYTLEQGMYPIYHVVSNVTLKHVETAGFFVILA